MFKSIKSLIFVYNKLNKRNIQCLLKPHAPKLEVVEVLIDKTVFNKIKLIGIGFFFCKSNKYNLLKNR